MTVMWFLVTIVVTIITASSIEDQIAWSPNSGYNTSKGIWNRENSDFDEDKYIYSGGSALLRDAREEPHERDEMHINYHFHEIILSDNSQGCKKYKQSCSQTSDCCYKAARCLDGTCKRCLKDAKPCTGTECCRGYKCVNGMCAKCGKYGTPCKVTSDCCSEFICNKMGRCQTCFPLGTQCGRNFPAPCCEGASCYKDTCQKGILCGQTGGQCTGTLSGRCCSPYDTCRDGICVRHCADSGVKCGGSFPCCNKYRDRCLKGTCGHCILNTEDCTHASDCCWKNSVCDNGRCKGCLEQGEHNPFKGCSSAAQCCKKGAVCTHLRVCGSAKASCSSDGKGCISTSSCCQGQGLTCQSALTSSGGFTYKCLKYNSPHG